MVSKTELRAALLKCGEFFKFELDFPVGDLADRRRELLEDLKKTCFDALGNPSAAECERIKRAPTRNP